TLREACCRARRRLRDPPTAVLERLQRFPSTLPGGRDLLARIQRSRADQRRRRSRESWPLKASPRASSICSHPLHSDVFARPPPNIKPTLLSPTTAADSLESSLIAGMITDGVNHDRSRRPPRTENAATAGCRPDGYLV